MDLEGFGMVWKGLGGSGRGGEGWEEVGRGSVLLGGRYFLYFFRFCD